MLNESYEILEIFFRLEGWHQTIKLFLFFFHILYGDIPVNSLLTFRFVNIAIRDERGASRSLCLAPAEDWWSSADFFPSVGGLVYLCMCLLVSSVFRHFPFGKTIHTFDVYIRRKTPKYSHGNITHGKLNYDVRYSKFIRKYVSYFCFLSEEQHSAGYFFPCP
jgi:hypothetical protein